MRFIETEREREREVKRIESRREIQMEAGNISTREDTQAVRGKLIFLGLSGWNDSRKLSRRHKSHIHRRQGRWNTFFLSSFQRDEIKTFFNMLDFLRASTPGPDQSTGKYKSPLPDPLFFFFFFFLSKIFIPRTEDRNENRARQECTIYGGGGNTNYSINEIIHVSRFASSRAFFRLRRCVKRGSEKDSTEGREFENSTAIRERKSSCNNRVSLWAIIAISLEVMARKWKDPEILVIRSCWKIGKRSCLITSFNLKYDISNKIRIYDSNKLNSSNEVYEQFNFAVV